MPKRSLLLAVTLAVVAAACSNGDGAAPAPATQPATEPPSVTATEAGSDGVIEIPEWEPETRSEELAWQMSSSGEVTLQDAVDAFALRVPDFPGATRSPLTAGDGISTSYALSLLLPLRDELTAEQQAALDDYLSSGEWAGRVTADGVAVDRRAGWRPTSSTADKYKALLGEVRKAWIAHWPSHPQQDFYDLGWFSDPGESGMAAHELAADATGESVCMIWIHTTFRDSNPSDDKIRFFFAHELFHCMQWRLALSDPQAASASDPFAELRVRNPHPWLYEGSADWAAADLYRGEPIDYNDIRPHWFSTATDPLGARTYDAWPLFETAHLQGYDVYERIRAMHSDPSWSVANTLQIGGLDGMAFRMAWSARTLRRAAWGDEWWMDWVWNGNESKPPVDNQITVSGIGLGSYKFDGPGDFSQPQLRVPVAGEVGVLTVSPVGAPITTRTEVGTRTIGDGSSGRFCFHPSGCACPQGKSANAWPMDPGEMLFSFAASDAAPTSTLVAVEWDPAVECDDEEPDEGSSNGDPHLVSFDGLGFDVVTLGEFVLARDPAGDFEVQTRHEAFGFGAGTTAVAVGDGSTRVTFTSPEFFATEAPVVRVGGEIEERREFNAGALRVVAGADEASVMWPDGSTVRLRWFLGWFVSVTVPAERSARMEGLLGAADGDLRNDLRQPDGVVVDTDVAADHESPFALSWAVDAATTLFDYEVGESVETFRVPHPRPLPPEVDPATVAECAGALGERAAAHDVESCAYDVAATGDDGFVQEYAIVVEERAEPPELADPLVGLPETRPSQSAAPAVEAVAGEPVLTLRVDEVATVEAVEGAVLLARAESCSGAFADVVVWRSSDREQMARATLCDPQQLGALAGDADDEWFDGEAYFWLPGDGAYDVGVTVTLGDGASVGAVDVYLDPTPTVVRDVGATGDRQTLDGLADTVVYLNAAAAEFATSGLDVACAVQLLVAEGFPHPEPRNLGRCGHAAELDFPPAERPIAVVVFNRAPGETAVELTPTG